MELFRLHHNIIDFLMSLPIDDIDSQRAFIYRAMLDQELQNQIVFGKPPVEFVSLLISKCIKYGKLKDNRDALESILETSKHYVGQEKKFQCDLLIQELQKNEKPFDSERWIEYRDKFEDGIAPHEIVFNDEYNLPGRVFNIELLTRPILLRKFKGKIFVTLDRNDVHWGVYNRTGRDLVNMLTFPDNVEKEKAIQYDKQIHRFLMQGKDEEAFLISQRNLRWASGGVLSIVEFQDREWVPFFFRDIPPYGWQMPQGASEKRNDNLDEPWSFIIREFIEEVLIYQNDECSPNIIRHHFSFGHSDVGTQTRKAKELSHKHDQLRFQRDHLHFIDGHTTSISMIPTKVRLCICSHKGESDLRDYLVLFNITELGIEVVKVIKYELGPHEYIRDGEIYAPYKSNQVELIRAPVALLSLDYLRRSFENILDYTFTYEFDEHLPSIEAPCIPPEDIHIFNHDVLRRHEIALEAHQNTPFSHSGDSMTSTNWERDKYTYWQNRFGKYFFDADNNPTSENASRLFTPTAAKVMTYYFTFC